MKVSMIGTGYVGLVSGTCFAEIGHDVTCIDIDPKKIEMLEAGGCPIYEPGLTELIERNVEAKRIKFSTNFDSVKDAKAVFLGVGTPSAASGEANLTYLFDAAKAVAEVMVDETIIVIKSTVPVGTNVKLRAHIEKFTNKKFYLVNNPEFLKEGSAVDDFMKPDRVVIGYREEYAKETMHELYEPLVRQGNPIYMMSNLSAEMTKYASNCMLATKISFINEIARLCDITGADIEEVRKGMISDRRIGPHFLYAGPGYGGSCFPKDVKALIHTGKEYDQRMQVINAVEEVNARQKLYLYDKIVSHYGTDLKGKTFAFWGVAFKPNTDDIREAPAITLANELIKAGATVQYYDTVAEENFDALMESQSETKGKVTSYKNKYDALNGADALVLITEWSEFRAPDFHEVKERLNTPVLFDGRNLYKTSTVIDAGFKYYAIGKHIPKH